MDNMSNMDNMDNMDKMHRINKAALALVVGGIVVILSYYAVIRKKSVNFLWIDIPPPLRYFFIVFMPLAAISGLFVAFKWLRKKPDGWIGNMFVWVMLAFCVFAVLWSVGMANDFEWMVSLSLVACALLSIVLLIGACNANDIAVIIALTFFSITTVLLDCIVWQSFYFKSVYNLE